MHAHFQVESTDLKTSARLGLLQTLHGPVPTPVFMPVGTQAAVKGLSPAQVEETQARIILSNTYHLNLRPGSELIRDLGGLHRFMNWNGPILTDSGGFQVFSLAAMRKIRADGIEFRSHIDGRKIFLDPAGVMQIQQNLGSDIAMVLDICPAGDADLTTCKDAVETTLRWAKVSREFAEQSGFLAQGHHVFGIVQGSRFAELRRHCAEELIAMDFPGYAIGGVSVGEPEPVMLEQVRVCTEVLPPSKPRYVMGVGTPVQLLRMIALGADMFDCVMPSREARHGVAYTPYGRLNLKNQRFRADSRPLVEGFNNYTCQHFTRAYLRHLLTAGESLGGSLLTLHNLYFYQDLMRQARLHIEAGDFSEWHLSWIEKYQAGEDL